LLVAVQGLFAVTKKPIVPALAATLTSGIGIFNVSVLGNAPACETVIVLVIPNPINVAIPVRVPVVEFGATTRTTPPFPMPEFGETVIQG
jgi:hypothetical protein